MSKEKAFVSPVSATVFPNHQLSLLHFFQHYDQRWRLYTHAFGYTTLARTFPKQIKMQKHGRLPGSNAEGRQMLAKKLHGQSMNSGDFEKKALILRSRIIESHFALARDVKKALEL